MKGPNKYELKLQQILSEFFPQHTITHEHRFHQPKPGEKQRQWRFDLCILDLKIAFEVEGGIWNGGRHVNPIGFTKDCEKYNTAVKQGWKVFKLVPSMVNPDYLSDLLTE